MRLQTRMTWLLLALLASVALSGCTIIRYVEPPVDNDDPGPPPKNVDMLVMVELDRTTVQLASDYDTIIFGLIAGLAESNVVVNRMAIAPMFRRTGGAVPLIYGEGDPSPEFSDPASAIGFFAQDDGQRYLRDSVDADGENLAALGLDLGSATIYHPTTADPQATSYFGATQDGLIVLQLTARARSCSYGDAACALDGVPAGQYFTRQDGERVEWAEYPGGTSYRLDQTFFVNIATAEGIADEDFVKGCERRPGFNQSNLDYMESSANPYYEPLSDGIRDGGGWARYVDMCEAMSGVQSVPLMAGIGAEIGTNLRD